MNRPDGDVVMIRRDYRDKLMLVAEAAMNLDEYSQDQPAKWADLNIALTRLSHESHYLSA